MRIEHSSGVIAFPVHHMRGGTSTGLVIDARHAPPTRMLREELLRHLMGVPLDGERPGNRQLTGLGRGPATSNKVFFVEIEQADSRPRLVSTLAQLAAGHARIDWSVNCGNMSAALPLWAFERGVMHATSGVAAIDIRNTNTGVITTGRMGWSAADGFTLAEIPGVDGAFPAVDLFLHAPAGSKTGALLPTGNAVDDLGGIRVSCVDVAVPMVIVAAAALGKTARETPAALEADRPFMATLHALRVQAGLRMGLRDRDGRLMTAEALARSETIPKICIVAPPEHGGTIAVRYFTPQTTHASMAVSGGCCLAAATLVPGSIAHEIAQDVATPGSDVTEWHIAIENPAGILDTAIVACTGPDGLEIHSAAYRRSAQILMRGWVPLYRASPELKAALRAQDEDHFAPGARTRT